MEEGNETDEKTTNIGYSDEQIDTVGNCGLVPQLTSRSLSKTHLTEATPPMDESAEVFVHQLLFIIGSSLLR